MVNRVCKISGVYFSDHAQSRNLLNYQRMKELQNKITDLEGQVFWDQKHGNYQILVDGLALPFELQLNKEKPGLFTLVKTAFKPDYKNERYGKYWFKQLKA